jgi:uncharacterized protein (TIGR02145 family)
MKTRIFRALVLFTGLALATSRAAEKSRNSNCVALDYAQGQKGQLVEQANKLNDQGLAKTAECAALAGAKQDRCFEDLNPLRAQMIALQAKIKPIQHDIDKDNALCPETAGEILKTLDLYEKVAKEACGTGLRADPKRCEDALFNIADINYQIDQRNNLRESYQQQWNTLNGNNKLGAGGKDIRPSYINALAAHWRYLEEFPNGSRRDVVLYRTAYISDLQGQDVYPFLMEISKRFPNSKQIGPTNLRLGEYFFVGKKYDSAIIFYKKVDPNIPGNEGILGLALYHKAEAIYHKARYQEALEGFFDYVERGDRKQIRGDLRSQAIQYMGLCFIKIPDSLIQAKKFFADRGGRKYEDTVYRYMSETANVTGQTSFWDPESDLAASLAPAKVTKASKEWSPDEGVVVQAAAPDSDPISQSGSNIQIMADPRNGKFYNTTLIGSQLWMAENLDFETDSSWCYDFLQETCDKDGRLYAWNAAKNACPDGWHLPSDAEWRVLIKALGGVETGAKKLKSSTDFQFSGGGTDIYGFRALPAGVRFSDGRFGGLGTVIDFWSVTEENGALAGNLYFDSGFANGNLVHQVKTNGSSVRCLKGN